MKRILTGVTSLMLVWGVAGCGSDGPPLVPVKGNVTLDGKALAFKAIRFVPEPGTPGQGGGGSTDQDGAYSLLAARPGATRDLPGVPAGKYRVVVDEPMFPIKAAQAAPEAPADGTPAPAIGLPSPTKRPKQGIPVQYTKQETTPLLVEVPEKGGVIDLQLVSKK